MQPLISPAAVAATPAGPAATPAIFWRGGQLMMEDCALADLATQVPTPFYCYSTHAIVQAHAALSLALQGLPAQICYAVKANGARAVLRILAQAGAGADVVSQGEFDRARAAGIAPGRMVFSGVGKTAAEIAHTLAGGIGHFNVESEAELRLIAAIARAQNRRARLLLRLNPAIDPDTHAKIATGMAQSKFGLALETVLPLYRWAAAQPELELLGLAIHIGSQIGSAAAFDAAFAVLADQTRLLRQAGLPVRRLDLGGGIKVDYGCDAAPDFFTYGALVRRHLAGLDCDLVVEPGRALVARAGLLVTRILGCKAAAPPSSGQRYVIVDAGMNDFMRPALYDAVHRITPVTLPSDAGRQAAIWQGAGLDRPAWPARPEQAKAWPGAVSCHVVGPVCESSDVFARDVWLPPLEAGQVLAIRDVGAYGAVLASCYNARPLIAEVLVQGGRHAVVRPALMPDRLLLGERLAPWQ